MIEINPGVTEVAHDLLGLSRETDIVTYNQDARLFMEQEPAEPYDLIEVPRQCPNHPPPELDVISDL